MPNKTDVIPLVVGLSLCGASAALLYIWFQTKDAEDECDASTIAATGSNYKNIASSCVRRLSRHLSQQGSAVSATNPPERHLECVIPNHLVPLVEGRAGANLRAIAAQTGCQIRFRPRDASTQMCEIIGPSTAAVQQAADQVRKEAAPPPIVTEVLCVPQSACGLIVGRCGEALQEICRRSMAKVYVDAGGDAGRQQPANSDQSEPMRTIKITGTVPHVQMARTMIEEKILDIEKQQNDLRSPREPRGTFNKHSHPATASSPAANNESQQAEASESMPSLSMGDGQLEVYVSAIASPSRFWLQLVGPQSQQLDTMVSEMTEYYAIEANRTAHKIADPYLGQIVAALFKYDGKWYRAEIVGILPNEYNPRNVVLDLYFVDFGDSEYVAPHEVYELRTDLLTLRFQAIECFLANVKSTDAEDSEVWNPHAISRFEEITHVAQWRKMHARIVTTKDRKYGDFARRENSPVPGVELFDSNDINIASMLLRESFACSDVCPVRAETPKSVTPTNDQQLRIGNSETSDQTTEPVFDVKSSVVGHTTAAALETFIETEKRQMLSNNSNGMSSS